MNFTSRFFLFNRTTLMKLFYLHVFSCFLVENETDHNSTAQQCPSVSHISRPKENDSLALQNINPESTDWTENITQNEVGIWHRDIISSSTSSISCSVWSVYLTFCTYLHEREMSITKDGNVHVHKYAWLITHVGKTRIYLFCDFL